VQSADNQRFYLGDCKRNCGSLAFAMRKFSSASGKSG
jgi:hypothetical protein